MSNRFVSLAAKAAAAAVAAMTLVAGLAFAGVDLPTDAAENAFDAVLGVELPNQGDDIDTDVVIEGEGPDENASPVAFAVFDVISNWAGERGCEFGITVATAATEAAGEEFTTKGDPCAAGEKGKATGESKSAEGKATGESKSAEGKATGESKSAEGKATGESKSAEGKATGEEKSQQGQQAGDDGREIGEEQTDQGQSNRP